MDFNLRKEEQENEKHATFYVPTPILPFFKLIKQLKLPKKAVFVDYGAGKARAMILAGESQSFYKIKGLEFNKALFNIAQKNISFYKKKNKIEEDIFHLIHTDAVHYKPAVEDNVFYFFHPFSEHILKQCMDKIHTSLKEYPRPAYLIYQSNSNIYNECITGPGVFKAQKPFVYLGSHFYIYLTAPAPEEGLAG